MSMPTNLALRRESLLTEFRAMTPEQRLEHFNRRFGLAADQLFELAVDVEAMRMEGDELPSTVEQLADDLSRIANLQMLPEVFTIFGRGRPALYRAVKSLPIADQERLCHGQRIEFAFRQPGGSWDKQMLSPLEMNASQIIQVFACGHIRNEREQKLWLQAREKPKPRQSDPRIGNLEVDRDRRGVKCGRHFIPLADLKAAVKALDEK